jgi:Spy/CpxP family protein refolding chaperone
MGPGHGGPGGMMLSGRALQAIGATADQQTRIQDIMKAAHDDIRKQHEAAGDLRAQMLQVFTATTVDARAAEAVRAKMSAVHEADSKRMLQAMIDASAVLTPEQRAKLAEEIGKRREMMQRHHRERSAMEGPAKR